MKRSSLATLLRPQTEDHPGAVERSLADGVRLQITTSEGGEQELTLFSRDGHALVEYDTRTGALRLSGAVTHVALRGADTDMALHCEGRLSLSARDGVQIRSPRGVDLELGAGDAAPSAALRLAPHGVTLSGRHLTLASEVARLAFRRAELHGSELRAIVARATLASERLEISSRELRSRVDNAIQEVRGSLTLKAGRVREWIRGSRHTRAERCELVADKDVRIDGKVINLG